MEKIERSLKKASEREGMKSIAAFASGGGSNLKAIIDKIDSGRLKDARIKLVISNNSGCGALFLARQHAIAAFHLSSVTHPDPQKRQDFLLHLLEEHEIDLIILAGYMKLLPGQVTRIYKDRVLNIHPALLPKYGGKGMYGLNVHRAVIEAGDTESGATVHLVTSAYDEGPILGQRKVRVLPADTPEDLAARVLKAEHELYWRVIDRVVHSRTR